MSTTSSPSPTRPADRYGARRRLSARTRAVLVAVGLVFLVAATTVAYVALRPKVDGAVTAVRIIDDHRVDVTFEVHKPAGRTASCVVRSRGDDGDEVGRAVVTLPAGQGVVRQTYRLQTRSHPVTGELMDCRLG